MLTERDIVQVANNCWGVCQEKGLSTEEMVEVFSLNMRLSLSDYAVVDDERFNAKLFEIIREAKRCYTEDKREHHGV